MRVVFGYAAWTGEYGLFGHLAKRGSVWPPLNLALLGAVCEESGHEVKILDGEAMGWKKERLAQEIIAAQPDIVGFSAYSPFFHLSADVAAEIKRLEPDLPIMVGGPHVTITQEKAMLPQFDYGFMGEAEDSLPEFLRRFENDPCDMEGIKGLLWKVKRPLFKRWGDGANVMSVNIRNNGPRFITEESMRKTDLGKHYPLDRLPLPARHLLPMEKYRLGTSLGRNHFTSIQSARGCPWRCHPAGTKILMESGDYANIESLKAGDRVVSADLRKGIPTVGTVSKTASRIAEDVYRLTLSGGSQIDITGDHPVWTKAGWRRVKNLQEGQQVFGLPDLCGNSLDWTSGIAYMRGSVLRFGEDSSGQVGHKQSDETPRGSQQGEPHFETAAWPSIVGLHARKESCGENVAHDAARENARSLYPSESQRTAVGQDFSTDSIVNRTYWRGRILDRFGSIGQKQMSRFYPQESCIEESDFIRIAKGQKVGASWRIEAKSPRRNSRLSGFGLGTAESLGRMPGETISRAVGEYSARLFGRWISIAAIAFLGRRVVYALAIERYKNFFANNLLVHNCIFCASDAIKTTRYIMKSPRRVVEEMKDIKTRFPYITHLYIVDDVLTFWPEHIIEICDRMDAEGLKFSFESSTRANLVDDKLIARLAKSGLIRLSFGLETIDPEMRVTMQKKVPIDFYAKANRICSTYGVEAMNSLMIGLPGETKERAWNTIKWVAEQRDIKQANLAIAVPYPGTEFHEMAVSGQHGVELLDQDFSKYLRYGNAVTNVGDLQARDLIELQNDGFATIYSKPWRWGPIWHKYGTIGFALQMLRVLRMWKRRLFRSWKPFRLHPGMP